ncbi:MAG: methionyl-tRNA formyltransferase [Candidatus Marinimicrobia bacterium]|nr:methionyl-tRNA formyltransferase [Candidatus Neomarinimicrobiota bacterium]MCH8305214.1 methionyl-tRNA formyltransferase [Candidatus Neomarinimicrobiota bacterium]
MGTPEFAVPSLIKLTENNYKPVAVVTGLDKKQGRGQKLISTPVKIIAEKLNIPLIQPLNLKDPAFLKQIKSIDADLACVVAFRILPEEMLTIPKMGTINLHGSLLPFYRGAAPIQRAIMAGEKETGVTTFFIKKTVDTGNILLQDSLKIDANEDFGSVHDRLSELGGDLLLETVKGVNSGNIEERKQDDSLATNAPKINASDLNINWSNSAKSIHDQVRGLSPFPGLSTKLMNKKIKIFKSEVEEEIPAKFSPGEVTSVEKDYFTVATGKGGLRILELQREGKNRIKCADFLRGMDVSVGEKLD